MKKVIAIVAVAILIGACTKTEEVSNVDTTKVDSVKVDTLKKDTTKKVDSVKIVK